MSEISTPAQEQQFDFTAYFSPSKEIIQAIEDSAMFYQLTNQDVVANFEKWKDTPYYKGDFFAYIKLTEFRELMQLSAGKQWQSLVQAIWLVQHTKPTVDILKVACMPEKDRTECFNLLVKGATATASLHFWLANLAKNPAAFDAIYDASQVTIGVGKYVNLQVLKLGQVRDPAIKTSMLIFDDILEIDQPEDLVNYLKSKPNLTDGIMLCFKRNIYHDFKFTIYIFFIANGILYSVDIGERRLNIANTAGCRNPSKYEDHTSSKIWLPMNLLNEKPSDDKQISLYQKNNTIHRLGSMQDTYTQHPECLYWLTIVMYRISDYITTNTVEEAVTPSMALKLLEDKTKLPTERMKSQSQADASTYLVEHYVSQVTSIVPQTKNLLGVIGTREYVTNLIDYERRKELAINIKEIMIKDWHANYNATFEWFVNFVKKYKITSIAKRALQDKAYPRMVYKSTFGSVLFNGEWYHEEVKGLADIGEDKYPILKLGVNNERVLSLHDNCGWSFTNIEQKRCFYLGMNKLYVDNWSIHNKCPICGNHKWSIILEVTFKDYRQICGFFNIKPEDLNPNIVTHLHQQNEADVGNSILDDVDPMDTLNDPWFRKCHTSDDGYYDNEKKEWIKKHHEYWDEAPQLGFMLPICKPCKNKLEKQ